MRRLFAMVLLGSFVLTSCSKEESLETGGAGGGGGSSSGALLVKIVTTGAQSSTQDLTYDANNRLSKYAVSAAAPGGISSVSTYTITRDTEGRVAKIVQDIPASGTAPASSATTTYVYLGPTDKKLKYGINLIDDGSGFGVRDSIVYVYTGSNVTKTSHYFSIDDGASYDLMTYASFVWDTRGNVTEQRQFADLGSGLEEVQVVTTEYDTKNNPCNFDDDAYLEQGMAAFLPANNAIKQTIKSNFAGVTITGSGTYEYRSDGKPSKSNGNLMGSAYQAVFSYK